MDALAVQIRTKLIQVGLRLVVLLQLTSFLWPQDTPLDEISFYDYIIIGGGTAGCILANRLTENGGYKVLLLDAGGDPPLESLYPSTYYLLPNSQYDWNFTTINDVYTAQWHKRHILDLTSGRMLGGSSSLGHLIYQRGNRLDYDSWAEVVNDETWTYENILPYFKKSENMIDEAILNSPRKAYQSIKTNTGDTKQPNDLTQKYLEAFKEADHNILSELNSDQTLGYFLPTLMIKDGYRQSMAYSYLTPARNRPNLHVLKETEVIKINFDGNQATSVTAVKNNKKITIKALKEVVISAGALKTPHLLMLSGIGPKDHLEDYNISVKSNLPVGKNYQDHVSVFLAHKLNIRNNNPTNKAPLKDPYKFPLPIIIGNVALNKSQSYPDYQTVNYIIPSDSDSILTLCSVVYAFDDKICQSLYNQTVGSETVLTKLVLLHPKSKGKIVLENDNYKNSPIIIPDFFSHDEDLDNLIDSIKDFIRVANTETFKHFDAKFVQPDIPKCNQNICPVGSGTYWECYSLSMMGANYDYSSTCSMGKVVDSRLRVIGVKGVRVIDASVIPSITSGNIQAAVMVIAEKGADMILEDSKDSFSFQNDD